MGSSDATVVQEASRTAGRSAERPKLGLALSGGGFRASFFHIGVLAQLARHGLLRHVDVISTVSGGSIAGALYYLHVKDLLESKADATVTDDDYETIVRRMVQTFATGVARNVRALTYSKLRRNFLMAKVDYSRSDRIGEIYNEVFFAPAWDAPLFGDEPRPRRRRMIEMRELNIQPSGHEGRFDPVEHNPDRRAAVPLLLLNTTSLNTGHNFRFDAVGFGEPERDPATLEVDRNCRLPRVRYSELLPYNASFELGLAVAASACVPALFHPLSVSELFVSEQIGTMRAQLVDGGVHDNQGLEALLDHGCELLIVSDASGQMSDDMDPPTRIPASAGRAANGIYGDRVREIPLIETRRDEQLEQKEMLLVHLRKGIKTDAVSVRTKDGVVDVPEDQPPDLGEHFGVHPDHQKQLARVRTDLDAFSEIEAFALMLDGYRMTGENLKRAPRLRGLGHDPAPGEPWPFEALADALASGDERLGRHLTVARQRFFKVFLLSTTGKIVGALIGLVVLALVVLLIYLLRGAFLARQPVWASWAIVVGVAVLVAAYMSPRARWPIVSPLADFLSTRAFPFVLAPVLWLTSRLTTRTSRLFVRQGSVKRVLG